jgi:hypothetical protein
MPHGAAEHQIAMLMPGVPGPLDMQPGSQTKHLADPPPPSPDEHLH